jgi:hypothetical protein
MMRKLGIPVPKPGGKRPGAGQPRFEPSNDQKKLVKLMLGMKNPLEVVAMAIINPHTGDPIGAELLKERFSHEMAVADAEMRGLLAVNMSARIVKGSDTMMIWTSKNVMGWTDHPVSTKQAGNDEYNKGDPKVVRVEISGGLPKGSRPDKPEGDEYSEVPPEEDEK